MKKDILAALTFLATGILFNVAQTEGAGNALSSSNWGCPVTETVVVNKAAPEAPAHFDLKDGGTRDS